MKIGLLEDSKKIGYIVFKAFEKEQIDVEIFESLAESKKIDPSQYVAFIVDYNLKDGEGIEFVKRIRKKGNRTPVIMLTVRDSIEDKVESFNAGADDYLTKPFELPELVIRIKVLIKKSAQIEEQIQKIDGLEFDFDGKEIRYKGKKINFSKREYQLIEFLIHNRGRILEKSQIAEGLWIHAEEKDPNIVNVYINRIRKKLKEADAPNFIETVRGFGYLVK